jgi:hypothetical protein
MHTWDQIICALHHPDIFGVKREWHQWYHVRFWRHPKYVAPQRTWHWNSLTLVHVSGSSILICCILLSKVLYMHKYLIIIHYILQKANNGCYYFKGKGLVPWPNSDLWVLARRAKLNEGWWWLPKAVWNAWGKNVEQNKFHKETMKRVAAYILLMMSWWKTRMTYMHHTISSKSNMNRLI